MMELSWFLVSIVLSRFFFNTHPSTIMGFKSWNCIDARIHFLLGYLFRINHQWKVIGSVRKKTNDNDWDNFTINFLNFIFGRKFSFFNDFYSFWLRVQFWIHNCFNYKHVCRVFTNEISRKRTFDVKFLHFFRKSICNCVGSNIFVKLHIR